MYTIEREEKILDILQSKGSISVEELCRLLYVSPSTIRRDLGAMERKGLVRRTFGGVLLNPSPSGEETSFQLRKQDNINQKRALCSKAAEFIQSNSTIFVDSSSTCLFLVPYLNQFHNLTLVTNGLFFANEAITKTSHKVILPGGVIQPKSNSIVGTDTYRFIETIHCDRFFFSCSGIDFGFGLSESNLEQSEIKRIMLAHSKLAVCLADEDKFGHIGLWKTCGVGKIDVLISERPLAEAEAKFLEENEVRFVLA